MVNQTCVSIVYTGNMVNVSIGLFTRIHLYQGKIYGDIFLGGTFANWRAVINVTYSIIMTEIA